jgi:hypothetical protein
MNSPASTPRSQQTVDELHAELSRVGIVPLDQKVNGEAPISQLRRSRRLAVDDSVTLMTLVDVDGVWYWQEGLATRGVPGRRAGFGLTTLFGGTPVTTVKLEKLGTNQIASLLQDMDQRFGSADVEAARADTSRQWPALREWKNGKLVPTDSVASNGKILVFVHGTFSNNDNLFKDLNADTNPAGKQFLADLLKKDAAGNTLNYDQVLTFDHYTVSRGPLLNALELSRIMATSTADVDIICHSRGGLVTRWFMEVFDRPNRSHKRAVLVGSPLHGTSLAAPDRIRNSINLFTNIGKELGKTLTLIPFTQVAGSLMQLVFSVGNVVSKVPLMDAAVSMIPGLAAMSRVENNYELNALSQRASLPLQYFAVTSEFTPPPIGWKFWNVFCAFGQRAAAAADNLIFRDANGNPCKNDLVVDTLSMTEYAFPAVPHVDSVCTFGPDEHVFHTVYFQNAKTIDFIRKSLDIK